MPIPEYFIPVIDQITLSVEEALVNIISYGYPEEGGTIDMGFEATPNRQGIKITIKDRGIPFNPLENIPPILLPINRLIEKKRGRVLAVMGFTF